METCSLYLTATSIVLGLISAASWLRASVIKVSHEKAMKNREVAYGIL